MRRFEIPSRLDELTAAFFGGEAPRQFSRETLAEALIRQAVQCHAMIRHEFEKVLALPDDGDPLECEGHAREDAYYRVNTLAKTIKALGEGADPSDGEIKRRAAQVGTPKDDAGDR